MSKSKLKTCHLIVGLFAGIFFISSPAFCNQLPVYDFIENSDGTFQIFADEHILDTGYQVPRERAERIANQLKKRGATVNWKTNTSSTAGTAPSYTPPSTNTSGVASGSQKALPAAPEQKLLTSGNNPVTTTPKANSNLPATTPKAGSNLPATTTGNTSTTKALPAGDTQPSKPTSGSKSGGGKAGGTGGAGSTLSKVGGVLGLASGAYMIYDSYGDGEEKASWADVAEGAAGGLMAAQSLVALNTIPMAGNVAYGIAVGVGTVAGASVAGAKKFAETDCDKDPVRDAYVCCNVSKLTNLKGIYADIGDKMFAEFPYVRTCLQGGKPYKASNWFKERFLDDKWSDGQIAFCNGWTMPSTNDPNMKINIYADTDKMCWTWECADSGMKRQGNKCVADTKPTCRADRTTPNGMACCDTGKMGIYDQATDTCKCNGDLKFVIENDKGYCRSESSTPTEYNCDSALMGNVTQWKATCTNNSEIAEMINNIEEYCATTDKTQEDFMEFYTTLLVLNPQNCGTTDPSTETVPSAEQQMCDKIPNAYMVGNECRCGDTNKELDRTQMRCVDNMATKQAASRNNIANIVEKLNSMKSGLSVSVWKNKDGDFNTSRLVSDSVTGIVLGTAGGLITSKVMKKNQLKSGFEDINCTIRGQTVAGYGDEFQVGLQ